MTTKETTNDWSDFSLMGLFRLEVETQVSELNRCLLEIEQGANSEEMRSRLEVLMRAAHSIKGAARIVQIEPAVTISHALEDRFVAALEAHQSLASEEIDTLLSGVDLLSRLSLIEEEKLAAQLPAYEVEAKVVADRIVALTTKAPAATTDIDIDLNTDTDLNEAEFNVDADLANAPLPPSILEPENAELTDSTADVSISNISTAEIDRTEQDFSTQQISEREGGRTVRISVENLNRLMGLAGESLVESNWLQPFGQSLLQLKRQQKEVLTLLERSVDDAEALGDRAQSVQPTSTASTTAALQAMQSAQQLLNQQLDDLNLFSRRFSHLSDGLYREVVASHMCAFEEGTKGYARLVRDLAKSRKKTVSLKIEGLTTQVDRDILSKLDAPIVHLITNAVVHGIEPASERQAMGKPDAGTVKVVAMHRAGMLAISVSDDGAGVDLVALRQKVVEKGLTTAALAAQMLDSELLEFLFLPGFSTAGSVDALAGRGYGLDLARNMAQSIGGSLRILSTPGEGTTFQFQLPLTLSVVRSLLFEVSKEAYALSLTRIDRVLTLSPKQIHYSENRPYFVMETANKSVQESVSLVSARQLLGAEASSREDKEIFVVVVGESGSRYGLRVDRFLEERELVVRPLDARLGKVPNVSAAAITERGEPILILDVADVVRSAEKIATKRLCNLPSLSADSSVSDNLSSINKVPKKVLVVDDSMTVRAMEQKLLQNRGYEVEIAVNGAEGWNAVRMNDYDLVVTDIDMPRMSGIELIEQMKAYSPTQHIPVIVVSYKDRESDQLAGLNAGANYYLTKSSFHDDGLINAVVDLIGP